jgi:hypothetical protein
MDVTEINRRRGFVERVKKEVKVCCSIVELEDYG